jgi:hypothetical protein
MGVLCIVPLVSWCILLANHLYPHCPPSPGPSMYKMWHGKCWRSPPSQPVMIFLPVPEIKAGCDNSLFLIWPGWWGGDFVSVCPPPPSNKPFFPDQQCVFSPGLSRSQLVHEAGEKRCTKRGREKALTSFYPRLFCFNTKFMWMASF